MFLGVEETLGRVLEPAANPQEGCFTLWRKTRLKHVRPVNDNPPEHTISTKLTSALGPEPYRTGNMTVAPWYMVRGTRYMPAAA